MLLLLPEAHGLVLNCPRCNVQLRGNDIGVYAIGGNQVFKDMSLDEVWKWVYILDEVIGPPFDDDSDPLILKSYDFYMTISCWCCTWKSDEFKVDVTED